MLKISIIIPLHNGSLLVSRCLDSVFSQKGNFDLEVIVIDDGSTDNSVDIIKNYPKQIALLQQSNQGPAAARNKGIEVATGKYLAFLDADDYWESEFLESTVSFMENQKEAIAVSVGQTHKIPGKADAVAPNVLQLKPEKYKAPILLRDFYLFWAKHNHVCTGSVLMLTEVVKLSEGQRPELRITEDLEFWAYLATYGKWGFIPKILFISDGGEITRDTGWLEKNKKRWESAPTISQWENRIVQKINEVYLPSFNQTKGRVARNLVYSMILSGRVNLARMEVKKHGKYFPSDYLSLLFNGAAFLSIFWRLLAFVLKYREYHRKL